MLTLVPVITPLVVTAPAAVYLAWSTAGLWLPGLFFGLHCYVSLWVIPDIYESRITITTAELRLPVPPGTTAKKSRIAKRRRS